MQGVGLDVDARSTAGHLPTAATARAAHTRLARCAGIATGAAVEGITREIDAGSAAGLLAGRTAVDTAARGTEQALSACVTAASAVLRIGGQGRAARPTIRRPGLARARTIDAAGTGSAGIPTCSTVLVIIQQVLAASSATIGRVGWAVTVLPVRAARDGTAHHRQDGGNRNGDRRGDFHLRSSVDK